MGFPLKLIIHMFILYRKRPCLFTNITLLLYQLCNLCFYPKARAVDFQDNAKAHQEQWGVFLLSI